MSKIWLTSDLHFCHDKPFLYEPRGFKTTEDMAEAIIENWNSVVTKDDAVYNLGDVALSDTEGALKYLHKLNGHQYWIFGNHDTINKIELITKHCKNIEIVGWATVIKQGKISCYLSHYPTLTSNYDDKGFNQRMFSFHGHTHRKEKWQDPNNPFLYNVALDAHECYPVELTSAINDIRKRWTEMRGEKQEC